MLFYGVLGVVIGGRLGYVLFYKPGYYAGNPLEAFAVWKGGMSFHGGMLGVFAAMALFARQRGRTFLRGDRPDRALRAHRAGVRAHRQLHQRRAVGPGGRPEPALGDGVPAIGVGHPAPSVADLPGPARGTAAVRAAVVVRAPAAAYVGTRGQPVWGKVSGAFLLGYGLLRFAAEYFREPDGFLGLLALGLSMGQWLCLPMIVAGALMWAWAARRDL